MVFGGFIFFWQSAHHISELSAFAVGVSMAMGLNILRVFWLKRTVDTAVTLDSQAAANHLRSQNFMRFVVTIAVLLAAALLPDQFVNILGAAIGIFTWPIGMYLLRFFLKEELTDVNLGADKQSSVDSAIEEMNNIVASHENANKKDSDEIEDSSENKDDIKAIYKLIQEKEDELAQVKKKLDALSQSKNAKID